MVHSYRFSLDCLSSSVTDDIEIDEPVHVTSSSLSNDDVKIGILLCYTVSRILFIFPSSLMN